MAAMRKQMAERVFKKMDADGNGSISKDEMQKAADERKAASGKDAPADLPSVDDLFKSGDVNGDGGISQDELLNQMSTMGPPSGMHGARGGGPPDGPPPAGASAPPVGASNKSGASASSSKASSDPADTNGDGKVSAAERRVYDYKQLMAKLTGAGKDAADGATSKAESSGSASVVV